MRLGLDLWTQTEGREGEEREGGEGVREGWSERRREGGREGGRGVEGGREAHGNFKQKLKQ